MKFLLSLVIVFLLIGSFNSVAAETSQEICKEKPLSVSHTKSIKLEHYINALRWTNNGKRIAVSSFYGNIASIWDEYGKKLIEINLKANGVYPLDSVDYFESSNVLITQASHANDLHSSLSIWDAISGTKIRDIPGPHPDMIDPFNIAWHFRLSPDGHYVVVSALRGNTVTLYDTTDWNIKWKLDLEESAASSLAFSPEGKFIGVGTIRGDFVIVSVADGTVTNHSPSYFSTTNASIGKLEFSPDGSMILVGAGLSMNGRDEKSPVDIISATDGSIYRSGLGVSQPIRGASWLLNGCAVAFASSHDLTLYDVVNNKVVYNKTFSRIILSVDSVSLTGKLAVTLDDYIEIFDTYLK